jgi:TonB-linked SusC/RagA family outer membrane protein
LSIVKLTKPIKIMKNDLQKPSLITEIMKITLSQLVILLILTGVSFAGVTNAQEVMDKHLTLNIKNQPLKEVLKNIESKAEVKFAYTREALSSMGPVSFSANNEKLEEVLDKLLKPRQLNYHSIGNHIVLNQFSLVAEPPNLKIEDPLQVISGKVTAESGEPVPGVNVILKGTTVGTATGIDGNYTIDAPVDGTLIFSFIGYHTQEVAINGRTTINVTLAEDFQSLEEVVVVGYGTVRKSDITGSVSSVKGKEINAFPTANVMQSLAGRASGVQVKQNTGAPGAPISVRIRGTNSIVGGNEPLYVVDGFPVSSPESINTSSIESIEILKDASAVAIYGSRASNGVVLITTNRGSAGQTQVNVVSSIGFQQQIKKMEMMNPEEFGIFYNRLDESMNRAPRFTQEDINSFAALGEGTDWQDVVFQTAPIKNHSLNISGGNEKTRFSITGSIFDQEGIIKNSSYTRYNIVNNIHNKISEKFTIDATLNLSKNQVYRKSSGQGRFGTSLIGRAFSIPPMLPVYEEDGSYMEPVDHHPWVSEALYSPLNFINEEKDALEQKNVLANAALSYKIIDGLTLRISGGIESRNSRTDFYRTKNFQNNPDGRASVNVSDFTSLLNENTLSYNKTFVDKHNISAVGGLTYQNFLTTSLSGGGSAFLSDITETHSLGTAGVPGSPGTSYTESTLLSGLGRVNYTYDNRYLFTASFRADGSSVYTEDNKWGYFPSAAFSWRLSEEEFLNLDETFISDLRLRTSWGKAGSQAISPYSTLNRLNPGTTVFGSSLYTTMAPSSRLAAGLKWETTEQVNIGLELAVLEGRIQFTADYYSKETSDLLNAVQLPRSTGYTNSLRNVGRVGNKGFEFSVNSNVFAKGEFRWNLNANISFNRSKVLELYSGQDILAGRLDMIMFNDWGNTYREGEPLGIMLGYEEDGYDENGFIKYKSDEKVQIGDPNPNFIFGINSDMSYKNFTLSMFLSGTQGNDIINMSAVAFTTDYTNGTNFLKEVFTNHWTPENPNAKYPRPTTDQDNRFSDRYVEDGSYIRLRNIELGYSLPVQSIGMRNAQVFISGQNILTLTKYSWVDPDVNSRGGSNSLDQGIDYSTYPSAKTFTAGVRLGF